MWFKQFQLFQLKDKIPSLQQLSEQLELLAFISCPPSMHSSSGWISPFEGVDNAPLLHAVNGYIMLCLQIEEKILPATVIRQELSEKIRQIEITADRKVRQKEKLSLKDEIILTLLPRAFTKLTRIYAYIDTKNDLVVLNSTHSAKTELFISLFKKSITEAIHSFEFHKLSPIMTHWLKTQEYPRPISVEKACVLHDPNQQNRIIRCQQQDLFASSIQALIKDGCEAKQLALSWEDRLNFILADDFTVRSIQYQDEVIAQANEIDSETKQQQFDADFFIMTETLSGLINDLLQFFAKKTTHLVEELPAVVNA